MTATTGPAAGSPGAKIKAGIVSQGTSNLRFHALRDDGTAACSDYLYVIWGGDLARDIPLSSRCGSRACKRLFAIADGATP